MTGVIGYASLLVAFALALRGSAAPLLGAWTGRAGFFSSARAAIAGQGVWRKYGGRCAAAPGDPGAVRQIERSLDHFVEERKRTTRGGCAGTD